MPYSTPGEKVNHLRKNLNAIKSLYPILADMIEKANKPDWLEKINSENGKPNMAVLTGNKKEPMYDLKDPIAEAKAVTVGMTLSRDDVTICVGMGLGYIAKELLERIEKGHQVVIVEPSFWLIGQALELHDFSKQIKQRDIIIAPERADVLYLLSAMDGQRLTNNWGLLIEKYTNIRTEYVNLTKLTTETINQLRCNTGTLINAGNKIAMNDIECLPYVIRHRGVSDLKDIFKGKPCVTVSTGPSLEKNIHLLRDNAHKVVIVAVGQALRILLAQDIMPDFICTVDFGEVNMAHFDGLEHSGVPLICLNRTYAPLIQRWQGPKFVAAAPVDVAERSVASILNHKGNIEQGGSVAHMCFGVTQHMGCDPIIFMGQDLALTDKSHSSQADAMGTVKVKEDGTIDWDVTDQRCSIHGKSHSMGYMITVPGYWGKPVMTNVGLASFITAFERMIESCQVRVINCTEGGAKLKGSDQMRLKTAFEKYCKEPIAKLEVVEPLLTEDPNSQKLVDEVIPLFKKEMRTLTLINIHAKNAIKYGNDLKSGLSHRKIKKALAANHRYTVRTHDEAKKIPLILLAIYKESRMIESKELKVKGTQTNLIKNKDDLATRIKRNRLILDAARNTAKEMKKLYGEVLSILTGETSLKEFERKEPSLTDAEEYFAAGNFTRPLLDAKERLARNGPCDKEAGRVFAKANAMRTKSTQKAIKDYEAEDIFTDELLQYNKFIDDAREIGHKEQDYKAALEMLEEAHKFQPNRIEAMWGLATAYHHLGELEKSVSYYEKLIVEQPDNPRYKFELGQVYLRDGQIEEGLKRIESVIGKDPNFESFLPALARIYSKKGESNKAVSYLKRYLGKYPADYKAMKYLIEVLRTIPGNEQEIENIENKLGNLVAD